MAFEANQKRIKKALYRGFRHADGTAQACKVTGNSEYDWENLKSSNHLRNHSPDGYDWGYGGSGPAQLALSILADYRDELTALKFYQDFKWEVVIKLPYNEWCLTDDDIRDALDKIAKKQKGRA